MSWPGTDFECRIQAKLDAGAVVAKKAKYHQLALLFPDALESHMKAYAELTEALRAYEEIEC